MGPQKILYANPAWVSFSTTSLVSSQNRLALNLLLWLKAVEYIFVCRGSEWQ